VWAGHAGEAIIIDDEKGDSSIKCIWEEPSIGRSRPSQEEDSVKINAKV